MKGIDKLIAAVKEDCANGQGCFNPDGVVIKSYIAMKTRPILNSSSVE